MSTNELITSYRRMKSGSNRSFGLVFAGFFALIATSPLLSGSAIRLWAVVPALCFLTAGLAAPQLLASLNHLWSHVGLLLSRIISPVIMGLLYAILIVPAGLIFKAKGRDLLHLRWQPKAPTYWIQRTSPSPFAGSMLKQF